VKTAHKTPILNGDREAVWLDHLKASPVALGHEPQEVGSRRIVTELVIVRVRQLRRAKHEPRRD